MNYRNGGAHIDTLSGRGERVNLNWPTSRPGPLTESDMQHLDSTPIPPPPVRTLPRRKSIRKLLARAIMGPIWRYHLKCLVEEREYYEWLEYETISAGGNPFIGTQYRFNCDAMERDLRSKLAMLEVE